MEQEKKALEDVQIALKAIREAVDEKAGKYESEVKEMKEKVIEAVKTFEDYKASAEVEVKKQEDRIDLLEKIAAKGKADPEKIDIKAATGHLMQALVQATTEEKSITEFKARSATDPQAGGIYVNPQFLPSLLLSYMRDANPMFNEATILTQQSTSGIAFARKKLIDGAKPAGEKQASRGKTKRNLEKKTISLTRYYSQEAATEEFLTGQNVEGESVILQDIMFDLGLNIQDDMLRGDGNNSKPFGLLNEKFLTDTATPTVGTGGSLTWKDLYNVQKAFNYERYRLSGKFFFTFDILVQFLTETDNEGRPIYQPGINGSISATMAGKPYTIMPGMDSTVAANTLPLLFGDMKRAYLGLLNGVYKTYRDEITRKEEGFTEYGICTFAGGSTWDEEAIRAVKGV
ncbi:phage major capsid protein [Neisseria sp. Ec49-e6-T10]|uniref:phage major capsid protein n=1 Tax=Neisseria sp. Ec49-e6-T10 TaxID=3140744 RepID=UPI003EC07AF8